jgi:hypothetical protein
VSTLTKADFKRGDLVHPDPEGLGVPASTIGQTFKVAKINPKNIQADSLIEGQRGINFPPHLLLKGEAPKTNVFAPVLGVPYVPTPDAGAIVTFKRPPAGSTTETPYVVLGEKTGKVRIAKLGGEGGRYWRIVPAGLEVRSVEWLAGQLLEAVTA